MTLVRIFVVAACVLVGLPGSARADSPMDQARQHVQVADVAYKLGKFDEALVEYTRAYELFTAPPLLFNIAQCHKNLKNYAKAIFFYEGYLRDSPNAPNQALVTDLIRESKLELDRQAADEVANRTAAEARQKAADEARARAEADARRREDEDRRVAEARRQAELVRPVAETPLYKKWWFWSAVGGAAVLAAGSTLYYFSGDTTIVQPMGSLGGLDRR